MIDLPREIEESTVKAWTRTGAIQLESTGNENSYYIDEFGNEFFCKNYPQTYDAHCYPLRPW